MKHAENADHCIEDYITLTLPQNKYKHKTNLPRPPTRARGLTLKERLACFKMKVLDFFPRCAIELIHLLHFHFQILNFSLAALQVQPRSSNFLFKRKFLFAMLLLLRPERISDCLLRMMSHKPEASSIAFFNSSYLARRASDSSSFLSLTPSTCPERSRSARAFPSSAPSLFGPAPSIF